MGGWGKPESRVRMEANALGQDGQDISRRPKVHAGIHLSAPFPKKVLQRPAPAQGHGGGGRSWHLPPASPAPPCSEWVRLPVLGAESPHSVLCSLGLQGVGQAGRVLDGQGQVFTGRPVTWDSPICSLGWIEACCFRGCGAQGWGVVKVILVIQCHWPRVTGCPPARS